jgi:hypothetical protein
MNRQEILDRLRENERALRERGVAHAALFGSRARGAMPPGKEGLLFLKDGKPVQPDPQSLESYVEHAGKTRGHWPSSSEIGAAMLERYGKPAS